MTTHIRLGLILLTLAACGGPAGETTSTTTTTTTTTTSSTTSTSLPAGQLEVLTEGLPRTGRYAFLDFTMNAAALGRIEPRTYLQESREASDDLHVFLELTMDNRSESDAVNWPPNPMSLRLADGADIAPIMVSGRPHIGLAPLNSTDVVVAFAVPDGTDFTDASFVVRQADRIEAVLPLTGPVPDSPYPILLELAGTGPAQSQGVGCRQSLDVTVLGGRIDIDLLDAPWPSTYGARRAVTGDRFLSVDVRVLNNGGSRCGGGASNFSSDDVRLIVDDTPLAPITFVNLAIPLDATDEATFDFAFPEDAETLVFTIGSTDLTRFELPIDLSVLSDAP